MRLFLNQNKFVFIWLNHSSINDFLINLSKYTLQIQEFLYYITTIAFDESTES